MIKFYNELLTENKIDIYSPFQKTKEEYILPNSYYINPNGLLFNSFGEEGHKEANLVYTYNLIKDYFNDKKYTSFFGEFSIVLEDVLKKELINYKRILENKCVTKEDILNYIHIDCADLNDPLLVNLVLGIISSKIILLEKFIDLKNNSKDKKKDFDEIVKQSNDDIKDVLVRYCGFHKIESQLDKTITTSSLDLNSFRNYLDNDFCINIVPNIMDNNELHKTLVIDKFLEENKEYQNKVFIK